MANLAILPEELKVRQQLYLLLQEKLRRKLGIQLFQKQEQVRLCKDKRIVLRVGRRGGKTDFLCADISDNLLNVPGCNLLYLAKSGDSAKDIVWPKLMKILGEKPGIKINEHDHSITNVGNKSRLKLGGGDKEPDTWRGQAYHRVYIDEAAFIRDLKYLVLEVIEPALMDYEGTLFLASSPYGFNDFYEFSISKGWSEFTWTAYDNPFIKKRALERIKAQYGANSNIWLQEYMGQYIRHDGLVFKNFRPYAPWVLPSLPAVQKPWKKILVIDPGASAPTGYVLMAHDPLTDKLYVLKAINKRTAGDIAPIARMIQEDLKKYPDIKLLADGAALNTIVELQKRYGLPITGWTKKDIIGSYTRLISRVEKANLQLLEDTTKDLQTEMLEAEWKPTRDPNNESGKVQGSDHCLDALRYGNEYIYYREMERIAPKDDGMDDMERRLVAKMARIKEEEDYNDQ